MKPHTMTAYEELDVELRGTITPFIRGDRWQPDEPSEVEDFEVWLEGSSGKKVEISEFLIPWQLDNLRSKFLENFLDAQHDDERWRDDI